MQAITSAIKPRKALPLLQRKQTRGETTRPAREITINNNSIARDPNVPADARLRAGFRGIGDRWKQSRNSRQAAAHKHAAKHNY